MTLSTIAVLYLLNSSLITNLTMDVELSLTRSDESEKSQNGRHNKKRLHFGEELQTEYANTTMRLNQFKTVHCKHQGEHSGEKAIQRQGRPGGARLVVAGVQE